MRLMIANHKGIEALNPVYQPKRNQFVERPINRQRRFQASIADTIAIKNLIRAEGLTDRRERLYHNFLIAS